MQWGEKKAVKLRAWPVVRQLKEDDPLGLGKAARSKPTSRLVPRTRTAEHGVKYRRPYGGQWEELSLDEAMEMIVERVLRTRAETWEDIGETEEGRAKIHRTLGIGSLGGATLDNEENYLMKKLFT